MQQKFNTIFAYSKKCGKSREAQNVEMFQKTLIM